MLVCVFCQIDEELDELISRIKLEEGNTEFWKKRFLGEGLIDVPAKHVAVEDSVNSELLDDIGVDASEDLKEGEDDEVDEEEEEVEAEPEVEIEQSEGPVGERAVKAKEVESKKPVQMIGVQLLKDTDQTTTTSRKSRRRARASVEVAHLISLFFGTVE